MPEEGNSSFAAAIQDHLELRRRNAALSYEMPLSRYMSGDGAAGRAEHKADVLDLGDEDTGVLSHRDVATFPERR
jgi:hypothetical protein